MSQHLHQEDVTAAGESSHLDIIELQGGVIEQVTPEVASESKSHDPLHMRKGSCNRFCLSSSVCLSVCR